MTRSQTNTTEGIPIMRNRWQRLLRFLRWMSPVAAALLALALVLRLTWRDTMAWTAPTFYALPLPLQAAGWLLLTGLWWRNGRRRAWLGLLLGAGCAVLWAANTRSLRREFPGTTLQGPRVFLWNIGHTESVPAALHELITELDPDAVVLAESERLGASRFAELMQKHPGFRAVELQDGVACLVRGSFLPPASRQLSPRAWVNVVEATFTRVPGEWRLCLSDIDPMPPLPRDPLLSEIHKTAAGHPRTIIAGDFNTPLDSAGFDIWRDTLHHGFADCPAWRGPLETWGFGVPVLAIDHIWMSPDLVPVSARMGTRLASDHSWLLVECGVRTP